MAKCVSVAAFNEKYDPSNKLGEFDQEETSTLYYVVGGEVARVVYDNGTTVSTYEFMNDDESHMLIDYYCKKRVTDKKDAEIVAQINRLMDKLSHGARLSLALSMSHRSCL
jgi:hypothetical protein